jgi:hypothetical protein
MKTTIFLLSIMLLIGCRINAQDQDSLSGNKIYSVGLQIGLNQIREMNLLPLAHRGTLSELSLETEKRKNGLRLFQFYFTYSRVRTSMEELFPSANIRLGLNYSYNFQIFQKNKFKYYLGPQSSLSYSLMIYPNWDESHNYWANFLTLGASNVVSVSPGNDNEWVTSLNFSVFGIFSRPEESRPYKMDDNTSGGVLKELNSNIEPGSMNNLLQVNFKTEYRFPVFVTKREAITFNMDIIRIAGKEGQPVLQIISRIGIKIML